MDIFILDTLFRPIDVVDEFISIIWTERWKDIGDFQLVVMATPANRKRFVYEAMISIPDSKRVMIIETLEETVDEENGAILTVKGRDLLSILEKRLAIYWSPFDENFKPVWWMSGWSSANTMRYMFWKICVDAGLNPKDTIPFMQWGDGSIGAWETLYPPDTIPEDPTIKVWGQKADTLYNALKEIADIYEYGIRLYKNPDESKLYFNVYTGSDRTSAQTTLPAVIFSTDMDNLQSTTEYGDISKEINVVYVVYFYKDELENDQSLSVVVTDQDFSVDPNSAGFERKVKLISLTSLPEEVTNTLDYLQQLGEEELRKLRPIIAFDGEITESNQYQYERDYYLGDLIELRGRDGQTAYMRVEEQIISEDQNGKHSYPTFTTKRYASVGTWASWKYDVEWSAMGSEEYWENQ